MDQQKDTNIHWHDGRVTREQRTKLLGHRGATVWLTGLSGSGKSTIAVELEARLIEMGKLAYRLDGDNVRMGINKDLGFSAEDRIENIRRIGEVAKLFVDSGVIVISSFVSPYASDREKVRLLHEESNMLFLEVFVDCSLAIAEERDPKGLYKKARDGLIKGFTGIDDPYDSPDRPDIHLQSNFLSVKDEVDIILKALLEKEIITS